MTAARTASTPLPVAGTYRIRPERSTVTYAGRHLFGLGVVHATFRINSGEIKVADPPTTSTVTVSIDAASFASGHARRDKDVRGAALLDTPAYPDITFTSNHLGWDGNHWLLNGSVTAHGTPVPVDVVCDRIALEPGGILVLAHAHHLDRQAFGITGSKGLAGRYLDLDLVIYADPA